MGLLIIYIKVVSTRSLTSKGIMYIKSIENVKLRAVQSTYRTKTNWSATRYYALDSAPFKLQPRPIATPAPMFGVVLSNPVWVGVGVGALHTSDV